MQKNNPQTIEEAMNLVRTILNQGDTRYNDTKAEVTLSSFLLNQAISIKEKEIPLTKKPKERIPRHFVQNDEKIIAEILLKMKGFNKSQIFFERRFFGSVPDVLAEKEGFLVLVECCSCRISKIIEYLPNVNEIWVLTIGENPWEEKPLFEKMQWFIFKKAKNWDRIYNEFKKKKKEELKKIPSPIDNL